VVDYLYHEPLRRYSGTLTIPGQNPQLPTFRITLQIILSDLKHNRYSLTITPNFVPASHNDYEAIIDKDLFIICITPSVQYHYRITPGALTLIASDAKLVTNVPTTLFEVTS
jgi:hypothetical protein